MSTPTRGERLTEFYRRLGEAEPAGSGTEALELLGRILNEVEDAMTGIRYDPDTQGSDGRMYPPQEDARRRVPGEPDVVRYRTRGHNVFIRSNGAIEIQRVGVGDVEFHKAGNDGRTVWER